MATFIQTVMGYFGWGAFAMQDRVGDQINVPVTSVVTNAESMGPDDALQLDTVWSCIDRRATTVASLPLFVYEQANGQKQLARTSRLWWLLHESPNARMTPFDFWRVMVMNYDLRGNAYARIERDNRGEAIALWPMMADQVKVTVLDDGTMVYEYRLGNDVAILSADNVLHLRNMGNGTVGMDKLAFMRAGVDEAAAQVRSASTVWGTNGKPTGVLMIDNVLKPEQRTALQQRFGEMAAGNASRLYLLEANMKYQQISISPEQQQLLESRQFTVETICRWYDVPPVLVHHANVTTWGSGIEQLVDGFYKFSIRPLVVAIEQALRKHVLTSGQRVRNSVEFSLDALLRGNLKDRMGIYSTAVQNGVMSRNECRQLENLPPSTAPNANELTVQTNLVPIAKLGETMTQGAANGGNQDPIQQ